MHIYVHTYVPMLVCRIKHIPYVTQFELRFYAIYTTKVPTYYTIRLLITYQSYPASIGVIFAYSHACDSAS